MYINMPADYFIRGPQVATDPCTVAVRRFQRDDRIDLSNTWRTLKPIWEVHDRTYNFICNTIQIFINYITLKTVYILIFNRHITHSHFLILYQVVSKQTAEFFTPCFLRNKNDYCYDIFMISWLTHFSTKISV